MEPTGAGTSTGIDLPLRYLLIVNISKQNNITELIKCSIAFGFVPLLVDRSMSEEHKSIELSVGDGTTANALSFHSMDCCRKWLRDRAVFIVGIELEERAVSVLERPFPFSGRGIALVPGNEGSGMSAQAKAFCDGFLFIPQYGNGTASLNVHVATAMAMHTCCQRTP